MKTAKLYEISKLIWVYILIRNPPNYISKHKYSVVCTAGRIHIGRGQNLLTDKFSVFQTVYPQLIMIKVIFKMSFS